MKLIYYAIHEYSASDNIQEELEGAQYSCRLSVNKLTPQQNRMFTGKAPIHEDPALFKFTIEVPLPAKMRGLLEEKLAKEVREFSETLAEGLRVDPKLVPNEMDFAFYPLYQDKTNFLEDPEEILDEWGIFTLPEDLEKVINDRELNKLSFEIPDITPRVRGTFESLSLNAQTELRRTVRNGKLDSVQEKLAADIHNLANHFFSKSDMIAILKETYSRCNPALSEDFIANEVTKVTNQFEETLSWFSDKNDKRSWDSIDKLKPAQSVQPLDLETMEDLKKAMIRTASANGDLTRLARKCYPHEETQEAIALTRVDIIKGEILLPVSKESIATALIEVLDPKKSKGKDSKGIEREELYVYDHAEGVRIPNPYNLIKKVVNHFSIGDNGLKLKDTMSIYLMILTAAEEIDLIAELEKTRSKYFAMQNCLVDFRTMTPAPFSPDHFVLKKHPSPFVADFDKLPVPSFTLESGLTVHADELLREYSLDSDGCPSKKDEMLLTQLLKAALFPQLFSFRANVFLKGVSGGGKSAYIGILNTILGGLGAPATLTSLDEQNFPLEHTIGAAAVIEEEMPIEGFSGGVKMIKSMTSGGDVEVKRKGLPSLIVGYQNTAIFLATNHPIIFRDTNEIGRMMRRFTFAAFEHVIENQDENVHLWLKNNRDFQTWFTNYILRAEVPKERIITDRSNLLMQETIKGDPFNDFVLNQLEECEPVVFSMFLAYSVKQSAVGLPFLEYNAFLSKLKATLIVIKQSFGKGIEIKTKVTLNPKDFRYLEEISKEFALLTPTQRKNFSKHIKSDGNKKVLNKFPDLVKSIDEVTFQKATIGKINENGDLRLTKLVHK